MAGIGHRGFFRRKGNEPQEPFFTFKTKFNGEVSFEITKSGIPATWYMGDGTVYTATDSVTHTYADGSEKEVFVSVDNLDNVTGLGSFAGKDITYFDGSQLINSTNWLFQNNSEMTELLLPAISNVNMGDLYVFGSALTALDWSGLKPSFSRMYCYNSPNLTTLINPTSNGRLTSFYAYNCNLTGTLDISGLTNWAPSGGGVRFDVSNNPLLTSIINPTLTNQMSVYQANNCNLTGLIDLTNTPCREISLQNNPNLTAVGDLSSTAVNGDINISNCNLTGVLNMSGHTQSRGFNVSNNPNLTDIILGNISSNSLTANAENCDLHTLDFSINSNWNQAGMIFSNNPNLHTIIFASGGRVCATIGGNTGCRTTLFNGCNINNVNIADITTESWPSYPAVVRFNDSNMTAAVVNKFLAEMDSILVSGGGSVYLDGASNDAPDASSGGYDGLAAKASLIAKGLTLITN